MTHPTNLTSRERQRFAAKAREVSLLFLDLAEALDEDDATKSVLNGLMSQARSQELLRELRESLVDSLGMADVDTDDERGL